MHAGTSTTTQTLSTKEKVKQATSVLFSSLLHPDGRTPFPSGLGATARKVLSMMIAILDINRHTILVPANKEKVSRSLTWYTTLVHGGGLKSSWVKPTKKDTTRDGQTD
jgi:hypothetical protein